MSLAVALLIANRALQAAHPEMSHADRSMLAAELVRDGHVALRSDNASVMFDDEARRRAPRLPYCSDMVLNAKIARARETCKVVRPDAVLAAHPGDDARAKALRAAERERVARERLGDDYVSTLENP